jgi:hypothetical protein
MSIPEWAWRARTALLSRASAVVAILDSEPGPALRRVAGARSGDGILFGPRPLAFLPDEDPARQELATALGRIALAGEAAARVGEDRRSEDSRRPARDRDRIRILSRDWHRDPESGLSLPRIHWSRLDYREPRIEGAVRRLWYAARHLDCPELALGYYLTRDERAAAAALAPIVSWIGQCPPGLGIHWSVPLELGLRLMSWSMTARLLQGSEALAGAAPAMARSVHAQAEHILTYRSRFSSANNHLLAQAAGLLHAGFAFSGLRAAGRWRRVGGEILWSEILRQSTPDGVSREASLHYQEFVLELGLLSWLVLRANGTEPPPSARARLAAMLDFVQTLDAFPGGAPELGDSDGQTALPFLGRSGPRPTLLALGAVLCERPEWKGQAPRMTRPAAILLGSEGRHAFDRLPEVRPTIGSRWFESGGIAVLRDEAGDRGLLFDCAPLGYLATAAHGHADCLAVSVGGFGQSLLIDPGTFTYHAEPRFRDYFRSTAAHNTLRIDGEEQSEMLGAFLWGSKARPYVEAATTLPAWDLIIAHHDGYRRLRQPVTHRRWVVFVKPDYFWIIDEVLGEGRHLIESFWHLPPQSRVVEHPQGLEVRGPKGVDLTMLWTGSGSSKCELWEGVERPIQGWSSPRFGVRVASPVVRWVAEQSLPSHVGLLLRPRMMGAGPSAPVSAGAAAMGSGEGRWAIGMPGEDLLVRNGAEGSIQVGARTVAVDLRGKAALIRWQGGAIAALAGYDLEKLTIDGEVVIEVDSGTVDCCLRRVGDQVIVTGRGGRLGLRIPGVYEVRGEAGKLASERRDGALWLNLRSQPDPNPDRAGAAAPNSAAAGTPNVGVL